jgi:predicted metal-dependent peptidase
MADIAGQTNFSYQRPSRRSVPKVILPSLRQPVPNIAVVVDTSGSMSNDDLALVLGEISGVLRQCGQKNGVDAIVCDAAVHSAKRVFKADQITIAGRGGTDMRVGVDAALNRPIRPHAVIILTDGFTPWPESARGVNVIAALIGNNRAKKESVPVWIKTVEVDSV